MNFNVSFKGGKMDEFESVDDILAFAITMEMMSHQFYIELSDRMEGQDVREFFAGLAAEELLHADAIEKIRERGIEAQFSEYICSEVSNFLDATETPKDLGYKEAIALAIKKEQAASMFYNSLTDSCIDDSTRQVFTFLALQEESHRQQLSHEYDRITLSEN